jgi:predicted ATPase
MVLQERLEVLVHRVLVVHREQVEVLVRVAHREQVEAPVLQVQVVVQVHREQVEHQEHREHQEQVEQGLRIGRHNILTLPPNQ